MSAVTLYQHKWSLKKYFAKRGKICKKKTAQGKKNKYIEELPNIFKIMLAIIVAFLIIAYYI
jgi:hypothetical protein